MKAISKTGLLALVKVFDRKAVERGLHETPGLLGHRDDRGRNWLHVCCGVNVEGRPKRQGAAGIELATLLLDRGLGLDTPAFTEGEWQATPLWYAVSRGRNLALAEFLLKRGANPNHCLWAAAFRNDLHAIRLLIAHGADIDPVVEDETPFLGAVKWSHFAAAETLLDLGANVDVRDRKGMTALHYMLAKDSDLKHFRMIARHGARGDIPNGKGITAAEIMSRKRAPAFRAMAGQLARGT
jgi:hypothetical protein